MAHSSQPRRPQARHRQPRQPCRVLERRQQRRRLITARTARGDQRPRPRTGSHLVQVFDPPGPHWDDPPRRPGPETHRPRSSDLDYVGPRDREQFSPRPGPDPEGQCQHRSHCLHPERAVLCARGRPVSIDLLVCVRRRQPLPRPGLVAAGHGALRVTSRAIRGNRDTSVDLDELAASLCSAGQDSSTVSRTPRPYHLDWIQARVPGLIERGSPRLGRRLRRQRSGRRTIFAVRRCRPSSRNGLQ